MKNITATIQVRMGSSRLPGKVMRRIMGKPLLGHLISRIQKCKLLDNIIVATSTNKENDVIELYCKDNNIPYFRGDEDDVLGRMLDSLLSVNSEVGVEVFGDCPLIDPRIVDMVIQKFLDNTNLDFIGNDLKTTFPPGMEVEVFKVSALEDSHKRTKDPNIREHGTLYIRQNPQIYNIENLEAPKKWSRPELAMEVDTEEDISVVTKVIEYFESKGIDNFTIGDIIDFMDDNPKIRKLNATIPRRWKKFRESGNV